MDTSTATIITSIKLVNGTYGSIFSFTSGWIKVQNMSIKRAAYKQKVLVGLVWCLVVGKVSVILLVMGKVEKHYRQGTKVLEDYQYQD